VDASVIPPLYSLIDLMSDKVPGHFYRQQLTKAPSPNYKKDFFFVEKVISEKTLRGQKYYLVKFLYYPSKFNQYVLAKDMKSE
jgi:hypothetical protein